jgi:hypothetical protein
MDFYEFRKRTEDRGDKDSGFIFESSEDFTMVPKSEWPPEENQQGEN